MFTDRTFLHLALIGALVASLGLAACGRKGPLDPPPGASLASEPQTGAPGPLTSPIGGETRNNNAGVDSDGRVQAPPGVKKRIPLDALLN